MIAKTDKYILEFRKPAKTSRGEYLTKPSWIISLIEGGRIGSGEISPLPDLSLDGKEEMDLILDDLIFKINSTSKLPQIDEIPYPSVVFGIESALAELESGIPGIYFKNDFSMGSAGIPINGLVWMSEIEDMKLQVLEKIQNGFDCIKIKVGAHDFDEECRLLEWIRKLPKSSQIELRLDANGAFHPDDALIKLKTFSNFDIHSIEQPIRAGQREMMTEICARSPIKIALDEELIGINPYTEGLSLIKKIKPSFLILKPTLLGGFKKCESWIRIADENHAGWWATSALESNFGLRAIAQWTHSQGVRIHQGLGTGSLFRKNLSNELLVDNGFLYNQVNG